MPPGIIWSSFLHISRETESQGKESIDQVSQIRSGRDQVKKRSSERETFLSKYLDAVSFPVPISIPSSLGVPWGHCTRRKPDLGPQA